MYVCARTDVQHRLEINFSKDLVSFGVANLSRNRKAEVISGATLKGSRFSPPGY